MGTVYRARDRVLDEEVALKVLRSDLAGAGDMEARFRAEIKLARTVTHPNVCRIHEYGEDGRLRYISMELVEGENLMERLRRLGPLPDEEVQRIALDIARGLEAIHEAGVVHRDLSPFNITLDAKGRVRVMDFGIAKSVAGETAGAASGYVMGNPEYMSPEQARGRRVDTRSDLYSLGVVTFEMLTGRPPFRGMTPVETLLSHAEASPPLDDPAIPAELRPVLARALAKDPERRFQTAHELVEALRATKTGTAQLPVPGRGLRVVASVLAALAVLALLWLWRPPAPVATPAPAAGPSQPPMTMPSPVAPPPSPEPSPPPARREPKPSVFPTLPPVTSMAAPPSTEPAPPPTTAVPAAPLGQQPSSVPPAVGWLLVQVTPWADVAIDNRFVDQTPMPPIPLEPGAHDVLLTHPDFRPYPRRVTIRAGEKFRLVVDLTVDGIRRPR